MADELPAPKEVSGKATTRMLLKKGLPFTMFYTPFTLAEDTWVEGDLEVALLNGFSEGEFLLEPTS